MYPINTSGVFHGTYSLNYIREKETVVSENSKGRISLPRVTNRLLLDAKGPVDRILVWPDFVNDCVPYLFDWF